MAQVFISYARGRQDDASGGEGLKRAQHIENIVKINAELQPWLDRNETRGSQDWQRLIRREIAASTVFILILTPEIEQSTYVSWELALAQAYEVPIIPVRFDISLDKVRSLPFGPVVLACDVFEVGGFFSAPKKAELFELIQQLAGVEPVPYVTQAQQDPTTPTGQRTNPCEPPASVVAFVNFKGGVGKTTLSALAGIWMAREAGARVLAIDLDPQENLTDVLLRADKARAMAGAGRTALSLFEPFRMAGIETTPPAGGSATALTQAYAALAEGVLDLPGRPGRLDIIAGDHRLMKFAQVDSQLRGAFIWNFREALAALKPHYDRILIDCGPSASLLSLVAFDGADEIIAPARAQQVSTRGLHSMLRAGKTYGLDLTGKVRVVFNMVRDLAHENDYVAGFREDPGQHISPDLAVLKGRAFEAVIPLSARLTDPTEAIGRVLEAGGDMASLGAAQARVEAFCAELAGAVAGPEAGEADLFGDEAAEVSAAGAARVPEGVSGPAPVPDYGGEPAGMEVSPRLNGLAGEAAAGAAGQAAGNGADRDRAPAPAPAGGARRDMLGRELDRLSDLQDRLLERTPAIAEARHALQPFTLEQKMMLAQRRTGLDRRAFLDRIVEAGVARGLRELEPAQRTLPRTRDWLRESLRDDEVEDLIRWIGEAYSRDR